MAKKRTRKSPIDPHAEREARKYQHPIPSRELILKTVKQHAGPATFTKLAKELKLNKERDKDALGRRLRAMERDGQLIRNRKGAYLPVGTADLVTGRVIGHADGFGFLKPDQGSEDIFLPFQQMKSLLHGDRVVVRVVRQRRDGRLEGHLAEILERNNHEVVGRYHCENGMGFIMPDNKRIHQDIFIPESHRNDIQHGQIGVAQIMEQPSKHAQPVGRITEVLGDHMAPGMEVDIAIRAHGLPHEWSAEAIAEATAFDESSIPEQLPHRTDLRDLPLVTIDGEDARDFDDAVYCEKTEHEWRLVVAIADVSFYVPLHSTLDQEAQARGTSVYFPQRVIPMLPEHLSNGLCSLNPKIPRLAMVCDIRITPRGGLRSYKFYDAVIQSHARLTYTEMQKIVVDQTASARKKHSALCPALDNLYELYLCLATARSRRGAIEFESRETKIEYDNEKKIRNIKPETRNDAHRIIEECMIIANVAAARQLEKQKLPGLYRVHEGPSETKLKDLHEFLSLLGVRLSTKKEPTPKDYARVLAHLGDRPDRNIIQTAMLRSLSQAYYTPENMGHFGLAHSHYTHFTSPIRRYPDLVVHRALRTALKKRSQVAAHEPEHLPRLGEHCSMCERRADEASWDAIAWLKCEYMLDKVGERYSGLISSVTDFGLFVELEDIYVEGLVHISALDDDYYHYDNIRFTLTGERAGKRYALGDRVNIIVSRVNLDERKIDFTLQTDHKTATKSSKKRRRKSRS